MQDDPIEVEATVRSRAAKSAAIDCTVLPTQEETICWAATCSAAERERFRLRHRYDLVQAPGVRSVQHNLLYGMDCVLLQTSASERQKHSLAPYEDRRAYEHFGLATAGVDFPNEREREEWVRWTADVPDLAVKQYTALEQLGELPGVWLCRYVADTKVFDIRLETPRAGWEEHPLYPYRNQSTHCFFPKDCGPASCPYTAGTLEWARWIAEHTGQCVQAASVIYAFRNGSWYYNTKSRGWVACDDGPSIMAPCLSPVWSIVSDPCSDVEQTHYTDAAAYLPATIKLLGDEKQ